MNAGGIGSAAGGGGDTDDGAPPRAPHASRRRSAHRAHDDEDARLVGFWYRRHAGSVYRYARWRVGSRQGAEDMVSEVFLEALRSSSAYDPEQGSVESWLLGIARNVLRRRERRTGRRPEPRDLGDLDDLASPSPGPEEATLRGERVERLLEAVWALPAADRDLVALAFGVGLSRERIGCLLDLSAGAVRVRLHRILSVGSRAGARAAGDVVGQARCAWPEGGLVRCTAVEGADASSRPAGGTALVRDFCCVDYDGGDFEDDGVRVVAGEDEAVLAFWVYEDRDGTRSFSEGDLLRTVVSRAPSPGAGSPAAWDSVHLDRCCADLDGGPHVDDGLFVVADRSERVALAMLYEDETGDGRLTPGDRLRAVRATSAGGRRSAKDLRDPR